MKEKTANRYIEAIGRRKTASARVRITESEKESFVVNTLDVTKYFDTTDLQVVARKPFGTVALTQKFEVSVKVQGSGTSAQAQAVSLGIARALVLWDEELKKKLRNDGLLKRDSRAVERKKPGLKKARKAPTWSKR
jgi:small subunit ribosomal protein S9